MQKPTWPGCFPSKSFWVVLYSCITQLVLRAFSSFLLLPIWKTRVFFIPIKLSPDSISRSGPVDFQNPALVCLFTSSCFWPLFLFFWLSCWCFRLCKVKKNHSWSSVAIPLLTTVQETRLKHKILTPKMGKIAWTCIYYIIAQPWDNYMVIWSKSYVI